MNYMSKSLYMIGWVLGHSLYRQTSLTFNILSRAEDSSISKIGKKFGGLEYIYQESEMYRAGELIIMGSWQSCKLYSIQLFN